MNGRLPSVAIRRALRGKPLPGSAPLTAGGRDVLTGKVICARCHHLVSESKTAYGGVICQGCRAQVESAIVEAMGDTETSLGAGDWCEERKQVEDWLYRRGM